MILEALGWAFLVFLIWNTVGIGWILYKFRKDIFN
jgi:ABC-type multidrug transport system permease subunit